MKRLNFAIVGLFIILFAATNCISGNDESDNTRFNLVVPIDDELVVLSIGLPVASAQEKPESQVIVHIECSSRCVNPFSFMDKFNYMPLLGAYKTGNGFLTLWGFGDGMVVKLYHVSKSGVNLALDAPTKGLLPVFVHTDDGKPGILIGDKTAGEMLRDKERGIPLRKYALPGAVWVWDGKEYRPPTQ